MSSAKPRLPRSQKALLAGLLVLSLSALGVSIARTFDITTSKGGGVVEDSRRLGRSSKKIRTEGDRQYLWAAGDPYGDPDRAEWFDLTGASLDLAGFQFGIGKDSIPAIDDPYFVSPDDKRLAREVGRRDGRTGGIKVIGVVYGGQAKAYPLAMMGRHELVNDTVGGKPVTVGW
ncbi:MAG: DUF3179 domain-containing protein [Planctomycetes bacterium]|nr:DUF3179 domain-containing protein [Planctomycetota bacterium]